MHVDGKVTLEQPIFARDFEFLEGVVGDAATPKLTIPSPSMVHYRGGRAAIDESVYPDMDSFWSDLTAAYADEVAAMGELGCTYLQFDDTSLAYLNDPNQRAELAAKGNDAEHLHESYIRHINEALAQRPEGMAITTHMCRGNFRSSLGRRGRLRLRRRGAVQRARRRRLLHGVGRRALGRLRAAALRAQGQGRRARPGDDQDAASSRPRTSSSAASRRRRKYVDVDQLCLSPQCGFSSTVEGNALTVEQQAAKLRLIVETAEEVWG